MRVELGEVEFSGDEKENGADRAEGQIAPGFPLGGLEEAIQGFYEPVGLAGPGPRGDAVEVSSDHPGDGFHGFDPGSIYVGAPLLEHGPHDMDLLAVEPSNYRIVVIVDLDADDCRQLKARLEGACRSVGLRSRGAGRGSDWQIVTRIAIEELEAWYFGDWNAVRAAYPKVSPRVPGRAGYRDPDAIGSGTSEAFERILRRSGYFPQGLGKTQVAAAMGKHINPEVNRSSIFRVFRDALAGTFS